MYLGDSNFWKNSKLFREIGGAKFEHVIGNSVSVKDLRQG